jgi:hypothetical protein
VCLEGYSCDRFPFTNKSTEVLLLSVHCYCTVTFAEMI